MSQVYFLLQKLVANQEKQGAHLAEQRELLGQVTETQRAHGDSIFVLREEQAKMQPSSYVESTANEPVTANVALTDLKSAVEAFWKDAHCVERLLQLSKAIGMFLPEKKLVESIFVRECVHMWRVDPAFTVPLECVRKFVATHHPTDADFFFKSIWATQHDHLKDKMTLAKSAGLHRRSTDHGKRRKEILDEDGAACRKLKAIRDAHPDEESDDENLSKRMRDCPDFVEGRTWHPEVSKHALDLLVESAALSASTIAQCYAPSEAMRNEYAEAEKKNKHKM